MLDLSSYFGIYSWSLVRTENENNPWSKMQLACEMQRAADVAAGVVVCAGLFAAGRAWAVYATTNLD